MESTMIINICRLPSNMARSVNNKGIFDNLPSFIQDLLRRVALVDFKEHKVRTRSVITKDLDRVIEIYKQNFNGGNESVIMRNGSIQRPIFYVVHDASGKVIGYCTYYLNLRFRRGRINKTATIYSIAIDDANKGQGWGDTLLEESISEMRKNRIASIRLFVNVTNQSAISLYQKHGFEKTDEVEDVCGRRERCFMMELSLRD